MRSSITSLIFVAALGAVIFACSSSSTQSATPADGGVSASPDGKGVCCPPDPAVAACCDVHLGGFAATGSSCLTACNGIPHPGDPAWKLAKDTHGCDQWMFASDTPISSICGAPIGKDAGASDPDASASDGATD